MNSRINKSNYQNTVNSKLTELQKDACLTCVALPRATPARPRKNERLITKLHKNSPGH